MGKYILIDLEDTITIHSYKNRTENVILEWLKYNNVENPREIYANPSYKNREDRLKLLNISLNEYKKWYQNFNEIEFNYYKMQYEKGKISINEETINFIKKCKFPIILVSNSSPLWVDFIVEEYRITENFHYIFHREYCFDDVKKPNIEVKRIIEESLKDTIDEESIMIGDSNTDMEFAKNSNVKFIGVYNKFFGEEYFNGFKELDEDISKLTK